MDNDNIPVLMMELPFLEAPEGSKIWINLYNITVLALVATEPNKPLTCFVTPASGRPISAPEEYFHKILELVPQVNSKIPDAYYKAYHPEWPALTDPTDEDKSDDDEDDPRDKVPA